MPRKNPIEKTCSICQITKNTKSWYSNSICGSCYKKQHPNKHKWYKNSVPSIERWSKQNKERVLNYKRKYRQSQKGILRYKQYKKEYRLFKQFILNALEAKRRAIKLNATPKWVNIEDIKKIYQNCPNGYQVDHIIPLQGKNVCGLHVPWNLQYLTITENLKKSNKIL